MKMKRTAFIFCLLLGVLSHSFSQQSEFPKLTGPYLGQKPPGKVPEPFAVDIPELQNLHGMIRFSPDGKEAYWKPVWRPVEPILVSKMENGQWTRPQTASFSAPNQGDDSPFLSPDGSKLFFISQRPPIGGEQAPKKEKIWVTERISESWSEPRPLPDIINSMDGIHWQFSVDNEGNLYFGARGGQEGEIYWAKYKDGQYGLPEKLGSEINAAGFYNYAPFIYPDGRLLLFSRSRAKDRAKIFVSVKQKDGTWTEAKMLFDNAARPAVALDGRCLFFARGDGITCWVEAGFIEELRSMELR
jgi:hypothetical protein